MKLLYRTVVAISITAAVIAVVLMAKLRPPVLSFDAEEEVWIVTSEKDQPIYAMRYNGGLSECRLHLDREKQKADQLRKENPAYIVPAPHPPTITCVQSATSPMILSPVGKD
jgi:hypothetical protein